MSALSFLHGIDTIEINDGIRPIRTLKSSVIGLIGTAGKGPVNKPVLITGNQRDAMSIFGAYTSDAFSIPKALNAFFKQGGVTVVVINVCDPATTVSGSAVTENIILDSNAGKLTRGFVDTVTPPTIGTTISAPYTVSSLGAPRTFGTVVSGAGTKVKLPVSNPTDYQVGETVVLSGCSVTAYNGSTTVTAVDGTGVTTNVNYTATSTGTATPPLKDRVVLPTGATLGTVKNITTDATLTLASLTVGQRVKVTYTATTVENTDYTVNYETGTVSRTLSGSKILPKATLAVTYHYIDPTQVTQSDILGATDGNGDLSGIEALAASQADLGVRPRLICAPGFTQVKPDAATRNAVAVSLAAMAAKLRAITVVSSTNASKEDAVGYASDFEDPRLMVVYPSVNFPKPGISGEFDEVTLDALTIGLIAATDNDASAGFWHSPSNRLINGPVSLTRPIDWGISDTESMANYLNEHNVTTAIREGGFRLWGNRMSDGTFITTRRTADLIEDSIAEAHRWAVDKNITKGYLANLLANVNAYMGVLEKSGAILGGKAWIDPTMNTRAELAAGHVYIDYEFTPAVPAERITFRAHIVDTYLTRVLPDA